MTLARTEVYLDYNAAAPMLDEVRAALSLAGEVYGNPSSVHRAGRAARAMLEDAREQVASVTGAAPANVIWTSGGTEANALVLLGLAPRPVLWASAVEHPSVGALVDSSHLFMVGRDGRVDVDQVGAALQGQTPPFIVSVMLVNNETGVIQPVKEIAQTVKARGGFIHCDAVQALGRIPIDIEVLGVDALTVSAHKLGGPKGVGAIVLAPGAELTPVFRGGGQERGRRAGTENTLGIIGFGAAAQAVGKLIEDQSRIENLRDEFERWITANVSAARIHGNAVPRVAGTTCVSIPTCSSETQLIALDLAGVAVSSGSACSSGKVADSHVLKAMGVDSAHRAGALRISLGWGTTSGDLERLKAAWLPIAAPKAA